MESVEGLPVDTRRVDSGLHYNYGSIGTGYFFAGNTMKKNYLTIILLSFLFVIVTTSSVFAQTGGTGSTGGTGGTGSTGGTGGSGTTTIGIRLTNPFRGGDSLFALLRSVINDILLPIGGVLVVLAFIYSGFLYVTAQGNEIKLGKAHKALLSTAIGTALLLGAWVFANAICGTIELISNNPNICP